MIHQQRKKLAENISNHEHKAQHGDGKQHVHDQLAANKSIDQFHYLVLTLAQIGSSAALPQLGAQHRCSFTEIWTICYHQQTMSLGCTEKQHVLATAKQASTIPRILT